MKGSNRLFTVDGKPFFPIGRHRIYMGGYSVADEAEIEANMKGAKLTNGNTVCLAIFWDQLEPEEGKFDFSSVDTVISVARRNELKLIFLWFATWKNGVMDYAPEYMKANPAKYKRVVAADGTLMWVLSSHCKANLEADKRAFAALCKHLKTTDTEQTVIGLQVENEAGILGSDRDYSSEAQAVFDSPVPASLISAMKSAGKGDEFEIWQNAGGKKSGTWPEIFGAEAPELMTAWSIASYINAVTKAGKAVYNIPMFINVWVSSINWWPVPGESFPSGGAVSKVLNIYKWFTPDLDIIAPDNPHDNPRLHEALNNKYTRDDNSLLLVESHAGLNMIRAISDCDAVGYFVHYDQNEDGTVIPKDRWLVEVTKSVAATVPLLLKYQGTGKIHGVVQEEGMGIHGFFGYQMEFDGYLGLIEFGDQSPMRKDPPDRGAGLIIQTGKKEFYFSGVNFRLMLRPKGCRVTFLPGADLSHPSFTNYAMRAEEGYFDKNGKFVVVKRRNGDSMRGGIWLGASDHVMHVIMCD